MENEKLFLPEDVISYFNEFPETIIDNRILYKIIYLIFFTLVDYNKLVEYLKENNNLKNKKILNDMKNIKEERNKNNLDNFEGINDDFTIENYKKINKLLYDKTKDKNYFSDLLEFCLINALMLVFNCGKDHTINIYLYDNFNKIKRGKFFENLEKNSFVTEVLKQPFESYLKETVEYNFNEETLEFTNDKKEIIKKKQYLSLITNLGKSLNDKLIGFFYNFEERVDELLKKVEKENSTSSKISPLIYMGMIIKFKKFQLIYEKGNEELKKYICSQIKILYSYPKSSFNYLFYILFTIFKIKNSSQIKKTKTTFKFEISQAFLEYDSSFVMASIIKYDKRIKHIIFNQNKFGEIGFYELGKNLLFNQNIIILNIGQMNITTSHLNFFNIGLNGYCSAIELNYNNNIKINSTSGKAIAESITKFPNLIRLNLNKCELGTGTKYVLKTILENPMKIKHLFLSKTLMDETSIKILNKIIEKKNCTIQILSVSNCNFNNKYGRKFLRSMCKNISIEELYMYNCELDDSYYCDVRNLIISGNLNVLSLYKNKFSNFESILKLIHLTSTQKKGYKTGSQLINLDLSVNPIKKNSICNKYIDIFVNVCYNTTLKILDISQTLNGENPKIKNEEDENKMDIDESTKSKSSIENSELNESKRIENLNERLKDIENKDIYF
jgi:hypothetical protein